MISYSSACFNRSVTVCTITKSIFALSAANSVLVWWHVCCINCRRFGIVVVEKSSSVVRESISKHPREVRNVSSRTLGGPRHIASHIPNAFVSLFTEQLEI